MSNKFFFAFYLVFLCCFATDLYGLCPKKERPEWVDGIKKDLDKSYIAIVLGQGDSYDDAKNDALDQGLKERGFARGIRSTIVTEGNKITVTGNKELSVTIFKIDEYCEEGAEKYTVHLLLQTARHPNDDQLERITMSKEYPASIRVPLSFVPGGAQFYKKQYLKGSLFLAGEALFVGGIAASFGMSSYYKSRSNDQSLNSDKRNAFENRSYYAGYAGWAFVGAAAALYIWNILDGALTKGEFAIFADGKQIAFAPTATFDSVGLAMNLNF